MKKLFLIGLLAALVSMTTSIAFAASNSTTAVAANEPPIESTIDIVPTGYDYVLQNDNSLVAAMSESSNVNQVGTRCSIPVRLVAVAGMRQSAAKVSIASDGSVNLGRHMNGAKVSMSPICAGTATTKKVLHPGDIVGWTLPEDSSIPDGIQLVAVL